MPGDLFQEAISLARLGKKGEARVLLDLVLRDNPRNEAAWIWLADCAPTLEERVHTLEECLRVIPDARMARVGLDRLRHEATTSKNGTASHRSSSEVQRSEPLVRGSDPQAQNSEPESLSSDAQAQEPEPEDGTPETTPGTEPEAQTAESMAQATLPARPEHRLPVDQLPAPGEPSPSGRTQPVRVARREPLVMVEPPKPVVEDSLPDIAKTIETRPKPIQPAPEPLPEVEDEPPRRVNIFDREVPRPAEPSPFTVTPNEFPHVSAHTPMIRPLKAQIDRRLERDLGLDVPLPPDPTQQIRVHARRNKISRGMIILYIAIAVIALLAIAAFVAGLLLSAR